MSPVSYFAWEGVYYTCTSHHPIPTLVIAQQFSLSYCIFIRLECTSIPLGFAYITQSTYLNKDKQPVSNLMMRYSTAIVASAFAATALAAPKGSYSSSEDCSSSSSYAAPVSSVPAYSAKASSSSYAAPISSSSYPAGYSSASSAWSSSSYVAPISSSSFAARRILQRQRLLVKFQPRRSDPIFVSPSEIFQLRLTSFLIPSLPKW